MTARFRWFCLGCLMALKIALLGFMFAHLGSPWSGVWLSLALFLDSVYRRADA